MRPPLDLGALAAELEREQDTPVLSSALRFVGRPGNALRALLAGDPAAAGKNLAQLALDLPTGGFLDRRLSLANLVPGVEGGDLTTSGERYTFDDLARRHGLQLPNAPAARFAAGLVGDVLTDPLTPLQFGGGGLAKGALAGLSREAAAGRLAAAVLQTKAGRAALEGVAVPQRAAALERLLGLADGGLNRLAPDAAEQLTAKAIERGLILDGGALRIGETPLVRRFWERTAELTAPALAQRALAKVSPETAADLAGGARRAWDYLGSRFYDRKLSGVVPEAVKRAAMEADAFTNGHRLRGEALGRELVQLVPEAARRQELSRRLLAADDEWLTRTWNAPKADRARVRAELQAKVESGLSGREVAAVRRWQSFAGDTAEKLREVGAWPRLEAVWDALDPELRRRVASQATGADGESGLQLLDRAFAALEAGRPADRAAAERLLGDLHGKLLARGIGLGIDERPFFLSRQLNDATRALLPKGGDFVARGGVKSVFLKRRQYADADEWSTTMQQALRETGAPDDVAQAAMAEARAATDALGEVAELDLAKLALRYGDKQATTIGRHHLKREAELAGARPGDAIDEYVARQFADVSGKPHAVRRALQKVNKYVKPALTVVWPSYHVRNALSAVVQTALDPDLGLADGVRALTRALWDAPALARAERLGLDSDQALVLMRAADADPAALELVQRMTIAGRPGTKVLEGLLGAMSRAGGEADLFEAATTLERLRIPVPGREGAARVLDLPGAYQRLAYAAANRVEQSFRVHGYLALLAKGVEPLDAAKRIARQYVDYAPQSAADKALRDLVPFARFPIAITPPTVQAFARRPGGLVPQLLREAEAQNDKLPAEERATLPAGLRRGFHLPLGDGMHLGSLGLPQEAAAQMLEAVPSPGRGFAGLRQLAAGLTPPVRLAAEAATGRSLLTGREFGTDRRAPAGIPLPGFLGGRTFVTPDGREHREIPPLLNELMRALPTSRFVGTVDALSREDTETVDKVAKLFLGVNRVQVDQRRATARALADYFAKLVRDGRVGEMRTHWARVAEGEELPEGLRTALEAESALRSENRRKR